MGASFYIVQHTIKTIHVISIERHTVMANFNAYFTHSRLKPAVFYFTSSAINLLAYQPLPKWRTLEPDYEDHFTSQVISAFNGAPNITDTIKYMLSKTDLPNKVPP